MKYERTVQASRDSDLELSTQKALDQVLLPRSVLTCNASTSPQERGLGKLFSALSLSTSMIFGNLGCQSPAPMEHFAVPPCKTMLLGPDVRATLDGLEKVAERLLLIEKYRESALNLYGTLLFIPTVRRGYNQALEHHRELASIVAKTKADLLAGSFNQDTLEKTDSWSDKTAASLDSVIELIESLLSTHRIPRGWKAPEGFHYLSRLEKWS